jgi:dCMP deaminase
VSRPSWDEYFLAIAATVATRADCTRSQVGAVIVKDNQIIQPGYNGAPPGKPGCLSAGACPRGRHYAIVNPVESWRAVCACGEPSWPCPQGADPGVSTYDTGPTACIAVHAEANALLRAGRDRCLGASLYVTREPCDGCQRLIEASGIIRVVWPGGERKTYWFDMPVNFRG